MLPDLQVRLFFNGLGRSLLVMYNLLLTLKGKHVDRDLTCDCYEYKIKGSFGGRLLILFYLQSFIIQIKLCPSWFAFKTFFIIYNCALQLNRGDFSSAENDTYSTLYLGSFFKEL